MVTFQVPDMTCGHCAGNISKAIKRVDETAAVEIDMPRKLVRVSGVVAAAELARAIQDAGYSPQEVQTPPAAQLAATRAGGGCCCGSRGAAPVDAGQPQASAAGTCCG